METNHNYNDELEIDLKELFFVLLHKAWLIVLAVVVCAGIAGAWTKMMITPQFESSSMLYILSKTTSVTSLADIQLGTQLTKDYQILIKSRPVLEKVIEEMGLELTYEEFGEKVTITNAADTRIINITVTDPSPERAKKLTDKIAEVSAKQISDIMKTEAPSIVEKGDVPTTKSSPSMMKNCMMAGMLGGFLVVAVLTILYLMNDTIRSADDIEKYLGLTTLGVIPIEDKKKKQKRFGSGK